MATSKPTITGLTRKNNKITATWNIPSGGYDSQMYGYTFTVPGEIGWVEKSIGKAKKTVTFDFPASSYYPNKKSNGAYKPVCSAIRFKVKGTKNKKASAWAYKTLTIGVPPKPSVSRTEQSTYPSCKFEWSYKENANKPVDHVLITSVLVNNEETSESKVDWSESHSGTTTFGSTTLDVTRRQWTSSATSGSIVITEDSSLVGTGSWTRWFKVETLGTGGSSSKTVSWCYGRPNTVSADDTDVQATETSGGMSIVVDYASQVSSAYPVDKYVINWMISTPLAGMQCPNWSGGGSVDVANNKNDGTGKYTLTIASKPAADQCLWIRVDAVHGTQTTLGEPKLVDDWYNGKAGYLTAPTNLSVTTDSENLSASISCSYSFTVPDSYVIVRYYDNTYTDGIDLAAFASGTTSGTVTYPEPNGTAKFGVYAAVGSLVEASEITELNSTATEVTAFGYTQNAYTNGLSWTLADEAVVVEKVNVDLTFSNYARRNADVEFTASTSGGVTTITLAAGLDIFTPVQSGSVVPIIQTTYRAASADSPSVSVSAAMKSAVTVQGGSVPTAPTGFSVTKTDTAGIVRVEWDWSWDDATHAELSWSDHPDAWMSTAEPDTYTVARLHKPTWLIADLETGMTWYFRIRFLQVNDNTTTYGGYASQESCDLRTNPNVPLITSLEPASIVEGGSFTVMWTFTSDDKTDQKAATVFEDLGAGSYQELATVGAAQHATIDTTTKDGYLWSNGTTHDIVVKVTSTGGLTSGYSEPATIVVAEPPTCTISSTSLETVTFTSEDEDGDTYTYTDTALTTMPLAVTVSGARSGDTTTVIVERAGSYQGFRPDETDLGGFEGETIALASYSAGDVFSFGVSDLIGRLDDGGHYRIIATVTDGLGQEATAEQEFVVAWEHQPSAPTATVQISGTECFLLPIAPNSAINYVLTTDTALDDDKTYYTATAVTDPDDDDIDTYCEVSSGVYAYTTDTEVDATKTYYTLDAVEEPDVSDIGTYYELTYIDTCDIYRLSIDKPKLIYKGATFGEYYVDLYPTLGDKGGYRFVTVSAYDDYITGDGENGDPAWTDYFTGVDSDSSIFDFNGIELLVTYNVDLSHKAKKDFKQTTYLGGSVQGDWGKAIEWSGTVSTAAVVSEDADVIEAMHDLMAYTGPCHVRTKDGSNYYADVQIDESLTVSNGHRIAQYSFSITRIDNYDADCVTYAEWREMRDNPLAVEVDTDTGELIVEVDSGVTLYSNITLAIDEDTGQLIVTENY